MFFKMLKSDLRHKKSLNFILFLFITIASLLIFVSAVEIHIFLKKDEISKKYCHASDINVVYEYKTSYADNEVDFIDKIISESDAVTDYSVSDMCEPEFENVTIKGRNGPDSSYSWMFCTVPHERDITYDTDNNLFTLEDSTVAVSCNAMYDSGVNIGDTVTVVTDEGNTYRFTIARFFKEPMAAELPRILFSDNDYAKISAEISRQIKLFHINTDQKNLSAVTDSFVEKYKLYDKHNGHILFSYRTMFNNDSITSFIISIFLFMISIAIIIIIVVTMRFTIVSAMKNEEKEIGMLKALGVDSLRFRLIFAAKYIAFTIVGGIIGIALGLPCSQKVIDQFSINLVLPESGKIMEIGAYAVIKLSALFLISCMLFIHRIKKINAIDALHGENHGERYSSNSVFFLHSAKKMKVPFYLAVSDIFGNIRHYLFLIVSYTLGIAIILSSFHIKNSVVCTDFLSKLYLGEEDFELDIDTPYLSQKYDECDSVLTLMQQLKDELSEQDIPISYDVAKCSDSWLVEGEKMHCVTYFGDIDKSCFKLHGNEGRLPVLKNEVMLSYNTPHNLGIEIGDTVKLEIPTGQEDQMQEYEFIVTAFFDQFEMSVVKAVIGDEFQSDYNESYIICNCRIDVPESEKPDYIAKMKNIFGEDAVLDKQQILEDSLDDVANIFTLLEIFLTMTVLIILTLITMLYMNIFIADDKQSIGLLRCIGYSRKNIRLWQMSKITIMLVFSIAAAEIAALTFGSMMISKIFEQISLTGFSFTIEPTDTFLIVPLMSAVAVLLTAYIKLKTCRDVSIHEISEE